MSRASGLLVATLTPFDSAGRVDLGVVRAHSQWLVESGIQGLCPCGTTGEWLYLSVGEKARIIQAVVNAVAGRVNVIAGVAAVHPREILLAASTAENAGANGVFLTPPIYYPAGDEIVLQHYVQVKNACIIPVIAYNIPSHTANEITSACVSRLVNESVIAGIKDSTADSARMKELLRHRGRISVLAASDSFASESRKLGADGFVSALANICPKAFSRLWNGEEGLQLAVDSLRKAVKAAGGIPALKYLASSLGFPMSGSRIPNVGISERSQLALDSALRKAAESGLV